MEVGNITKAATFKSFLHLTYKNTKLLYFVTVVLNIFMRQTLTNDFWGLHKNMNCAFPLSLKLLNRSSRSQMFFKINVLTDFAIFMGKYL